MKFKIVSFIIVMFASTNVFATNLLDVYHQALLGDSIFQQAISQRLADREAVPIAMSSLLPSASIVAAPYITRIDRSGSATFPGTNNMHGYDLTLNLSQTIFDFSKIAGVTGAREIAKEANANLSAALQDLMIRVSKAYFAILEDEDNLVYIKATRTAYAKQLDQVKQQFQVGLKTITDVYTAQASYEGASAAYIGATSQLANDNENLRVITGAIYPSIAKLSEQFPLVRPNPENVDAWIKKSLQQNWKLKAAEYFAESARQNIKQQFAGHFPTLNAVGTYDINYSKNVGNSGVFGPFNPAGSNRVRTSTVSLNLNIPLVQGGLVVAQTNQARYQYQVAYQQLDLQARSALNITRQSYINVIAGISKISADKQAIKSSISSLEGMEAGYRVGTQILYNVLDQQQRVFQAQKQYATDRYAYVINMLTLKQAAGILSERDLECVNTWLMEDRSHEYRETTTAHEVENNKVVTDINHHKSLASALKNPQLSKPVKMVLLNKGIMLAKAKKVNPQKTADARKKDLRDLAAIA